jgi:hypothetical protein
MAAIAEDSQRIEILSRRHVAKREGFADHAFLQGT